MDKPLILPNVQYWSLFIIYQEELYKIFCLSAQKTLYLAYYFKG